MLYFIYSYAISFHSSLVSSTKIVIILYQKSSKVYLPSYSLSLQANNSMPSNDAIIIKSNSNITKQPIPDMVAIIAYINYLNFTHYLANLNILNNLNALNALIAAKLLSFPNQSVVINIHSTTDTNTITLSNKLRESRK